MLYGIGRQSCSAMQPKTPTFGGMPGLGQVADNNAIERFEINPQRGFQQSGSS